MPAPLRTDVYTFHKATLAVDALEPPTHGQNALPRDIMVRVVGHLQDDTLALQRCALVCKPWLNECRSRLFRTMYIADALYPVQRCTRNRANRIQIFTDFLKNGASPGFCSSIRVLRVGGDEKVSEAQQRTRVNLTMLCVILDRLPRLRELDLTRVLLDQCTPMIHRSSKYRLETLSVHSVGCSVDEATGLADVLGMFSRLGVLNASYIDMPALTVTGHGRSVATSFQVGQVSLKGCLRGQDRPEIRRLSTVYRLLEVLRNLPGTSQLRSITVQCGVMAEVRALGRYLQQVGQHVEHLGVELFELTREHIGASSPAQTSATSDELRSRDGRPVSPSRRVHEIALAPRRHLPQHRRKLA